MGYPYCAGLEHRVMRRPGHASRIALCLPANPGSLDQELIDEIQPGRGFWAEVQNRWLLVWAGWARGWYGSGADFAACVSRARRPEKAKGKKPVAANVSPTPDRPRLLLRVCPQGIGWICLFDTLQTLPD
jgi:hypothetical protein